MPHKLLVAVDGSEPARRALEYAIGLAKEHPAISLHLLTVTPEPAVYGEIQVYSSKEKMATLESEHAKSQLEPAVAMAKAAGVPHTAEIVSGGLAAQIVRRAAELGCDGIVMGTHGMSAIGNLLMGSVATEVVHQTKLPVTLVK